MNRNTLALLGLIVAAPFLLGLSASAWADWAAPPPTGYPPGWNVTRENLPEEMCVFRPGSWGDTKRYWADQVMPGSSPSRPLRNIRIIYQMKIGSDRYEEIKPPTPMPDDR